MQDPCDRFRWYRRGGGGHLAELGVEVVALSRNRAMAAAVRQNGLTLCGVTHERNVPVTVVTEAPEGPFEFIIRRLNPPM